MTNDQCEAIIKAIAVGFESLLNSGVRQWQKVGDDSSDSTARTAATMLVHMETTTGAPFLLSLAQDFGKTPSLAA